MPHKLFYQTEKYEGRPDIYREFDEVDTSLVNEPAFQQIIASFVKFTGINMVNTPVEVHQIRVLSKEGMQGNPSPEGMHRDGFHFLGIFVVNRCDVIGGENSIHLDRESDPIFHGVLDTGQFLLCDDEKVLHNAAPIGRPEGVEHGYRDIFVLTAGEHRRI